MVLETACTNKVKYERLNWVSYVCLVVGYYYSTTIVITINLYSVAPALDS